MAKITDFLFSLAPTLRTGFATSSTVGQRVQKLRHKGQEHPYSVRRKSAPDVSENHCCTFE
ncbi:hypothetical protein [Thioclava nitratireducens]|uniref:hypothetical protein n=1 Tax=Thioclava nitratireducens TaxID=1915078 RepID=UPI0012FE064A|nr:hypothetical protein [Thioclava nitratireducens]